MSTVQLLLWLLGGLVVIAIIAGIIGRHYVRKGASEPVVVKLVNQISDRVIDTVRHPITVAVLDEVADVLRTGSYTKNLAAALRENETEIKAMVNEKIMADPTTKAIGLLPFHERIINQVSETVLRVILEVLVDARTEELVNDVLRDNIVQIRKAVRAREHQNVGTLDSPDPAALQQPRSPGPA